ncbi:MAG: metalloregulator ArsR/SmtB family transcription factor [Crocinitomicaceae bacterium]
MKRTILENNFDEKTEQLALYAKALSHPTRIMILQHLEKQSCCFTGDLVEILPISQSTVSQHLKELKNAGLIQGEIKPPRIKYCVNKENWENARILFKSLFD